MIRAIALIACLAPAVAFAQSPHDHGGGNRPNGSMHEQMMQGRRMRMQDVQGTAPTQAGQSAFAAIQEIVGILEADPKTDWSKVNIDALRQHLIDMNNVTLSASVKSEPVEGGVRFTITGAGAVADSIRRMVTAHAATMNGAGNWHFSAAEIDGGAILTVHVPATDIAELKGLGFLGVMTRGMHHQEHHLMIARGGNPHH
ncbi:MAG: hypothetical protein KGM42_10030 [Hyphomicrobiales bacterium]|nr:hypothetical protein [Hyphomicrobiales bacterium]